MRNFKFLTLVLFLLIGSTILFAERWINMPMTVAQSSTAPTLMSQEGRLWAPLSTLVEAFQAKVEDHDGQRVFCRDEQCLLLNATHVRQTNGQEYVDVLWIAEALGLSSQGFGGIQRATVSTGGSTLAPQFTLLDLDGQSHALSEFRGKKTVLYLWGSW